MITKDESNRPDDFDPDDMRKEELDENIFVNDLIDEGREEELLQLAANGKILSYENKRLTYSNYCLKAFRVTSIHIQNTHESLINLTESYGDISGDDHPIRSLTDISFNMFHELDLDKLYPLLEYATNLQTINIH